MGWRDDLELFGIRVPEKLPVDDWAARLGDEPARNAMAVVGLTAVAFFAAERGHNPRVKDIWDALVYCSTAISVGYAEIHPRTKAGKIIGSALMTLGPALAARTLDGGRNREQTQDQILTTLKDILRAVETEKREEPSTD